MKALCCHLPLLWLLLQAAVSPPPTVTSSSPLAICAYAAPLGRGGPTINVVIDATGAAQVTHSRSPRAKAAAPRQGPFQLSSSDLAALEEAFLSQDFRGLPPVIHQSAIEFTGPMYALEITSPAPGKTVQLLRPVGSTLNTNAVRFQAIWNRLASILKGGVPAIKN